MQANLHSSGLLLRHRVPESGIFFVAIRPRLRQRGRSIFDPNPRKD